MEEVAIVIGFGKIIVGVHEEDVGNGGKTPLQPGVYVQVLNLAVVLNKGCPEDISREGEVEPGTNEKEVGTAIRLRQAYAIVSKVHRYDAERLEPVADLPIKVHAVAVIVLAGTRIKIHIEALPGIGKKIGNNDIGIKYHSSVQ